MLITSVNVKYLSKKLFIPSLQLVMNYYNHYYYDEKKAGRLFLNLVNFSKTF